MNEERPIEGLETLKAPPLSERGRRRLRERIVARAELALARRRRAPSYWDVLAEWARPGLAAAAIALAILAAALRLGGSGAEATTGPMALDDVLRQTGEEESVPAFLLTSREPDVFAVASAVLSRDAEPVARDE